MICLVSREGRVLAATSVPQRVSHADVLGQLIWNLASPLDRGALRDSIADALDANSAKTCTVQTSFSLDRWAVHIWPALELADAKAIVSMAIVDAGAFELTGKQRVILRAMACGRSVDEVCQQMNVSQNTVRTHLHRARQRLGFDDLSSLVLWSRNNLLHDAA